MGLISDENLGRAIANFYDYHFVDLSDVRIGEKLLSYIPESVAREQRSVVFVSYKKKNGALRRAPLKALEREFGVLIDHVQTVDDAFEFRKDLEDNQFAPYVVRREKGCNAQTP